MTQIQVGLRHRRPRWLTVEFVVLVTVVLGLVSIVALFAVPQVVELPSFLVSSVPAWLFALFIVMAALSDVVYVPVRHADAWEELTFVEVVVVAAVLILPPGAAIASTLIGFVIVAALLRRPLVKSLFNLGAYAVSAAGLMLTYLLLVGDSEVFSLRSVAALTLGAIIFTLLNLFMLSMVLLAAEDVPPQDFMDDQWGLSIGMAIGSVGIATVALAVLQSNPVLLPFASLPVLAMWYAYRSSSSHEDAKQRSAWLVQLGQAVSVPAPADELVPRAADALRRVYGADEYAVLLPDGQQFGDAAALGTLDLSATEAMPLSDTALPEGWSDGVAVRLHGRGSSPGVLAIGVLAENYRGLRLPWSRSWALPETELPGLVALTSAVGSSLRAGQTLSALTAETAKLQAVVNNATDGICVVDSQGAILLWSPAAQRITGVNQPDPTVVGVVNDIITVPGDSRGHPVDFERADGQDMSLQVTRVDVYGSAATSVITIRDMTRERRAERLKSDFIATISHELRTPITPIRGYADLLKRRWEKMSEEKRESVLDTIAERADHLARLVDDLLMAARADTETSLRVDTTTVDLVEVVHEAARAFPEVDGRLHIEPSEPMLVTADRTRVMQIIGNLVGNAVKYTPPDSPIAIDYAREDGFVDVRVRDDGPGIAIDEQEKVFERFYRIEDPLTMRTGGSGLGLHISRQLARAMGGDVTLKSRPGEGSMFILRLRAEG
jgi:signal transduction histidine kinase